MECDHGCDVMVSDDHPVSSFMDQFFVNSKHKRMTVIDNMREIFKSHPKIWNNEDYRKLVLAILARIGTNILLLKTSEMSLATYAAQSIVVLENYDGSNDIDLVMSSPIIRTKWRALNPGVSSCRRDTLKFYRKRTTCKCLKKMHLEARKTTPKLGLCWGCEKEMERTALSVCSRCMIEKYCSRECQLADWQDHKKQHCDNYVRAHELLVDEEQIGRTEVGV